MDPNKEYFDLQYYPKCEMRSETIRYKVYKYGIISRNVIKVKTTLH